MPERLVRDSFSVYGSREYDITMKFVYGELMDLLSRPRGGRPPYADSGCGRGVTGVSKAGTALCCECRDKSGTPG
jgi:hypothetical protein